MPKVINLAFIHDHGALLADGQQYCYFLKEAGYETEQIDLSAPGGPRRLEECLRNDDIAFAFGFQGVGSCLTAGDVNLWTKQQIPFVGLHFDHPCHNPFNHFSDSPFVGNLYYFESMLQSRLRYLPGGQLSEYAPYSIVSIPAQPRLPFRDRPIRLLFMKGGQPLDDSVAYIDSLPANVRDGIWEQIHRAQKSPDLLLCDLVAELFAHAGYSPKTHERQFWGMVQTMDIYLRRKRAIDFVGWLKDQEGAVIVGNGWDFIDKEGARAVFRPSLNYHEAFALYEQTQFTCNASPYGPDLLHERPIYALVMGGCAISDANACWKSLAASMPALFLYDWAQPLEEQIPAFLANAAVAEEASLTARGDALRHFYIRNQIARISAFAGKVRAFARGALAEQAKAS